MFKNGVISLNRKILNIPTLSLRSMLLIRLLQMITIVLLNCPVSSRRNQINKLNLRKTETRKKTFQLSYAENMIAGGLSRAAAQAVCHPLNVGKTLLQARGSGVTTLPSLARLIRKNPYLLFRGMCAQCLLSIPNGAISFATLELAKTSLSKIIFLEKAGAALDLLSSCAGTLITSIISTPQTVLLDRVMTGQYPNFNVGIKTIWASEGLYGFYRGWAPAMSSKVTNTHFPTII